jgi:hypothetical protein
MGTTSTRVLHLQDDFWSYFDKLSHLHLEQLDKPFTEEEIKKIVFACDPSKVHGFSFLFYQACWEVISSDVMKLVHAFYHNLLDISKLNLASICLLPKKKRCSINYPV